MISVRLSEEEYAALRRLCIVTEARSVSDLARGAVHNLIQEEMNGDGHGAAPANYVQEQIKLLGERIEGLAGELAAMKNQRLHE